METWTIEWDGGRSIVHSPGGMIGRTSLRTGKTHWAEPFYEAPWIERGDPIESRLIANMRGDYACVGLGRPHTAEDRLPARWDALCSTAIDDDDGPLCEADGLPHGYGVHNEWHLVSRTKESLVIGIDYPATSPIRRLTRAVGPAPDGRGLEVSLTIEARRRCRRPVGLHPNFAVKGPPGSFRIRPGRFAFGLTHVFGDRGVSKLLPDAEFSDLGAVPLAEGGTCALDAMPFSEPAEEFVQLCGLEGAMEFEDRHLGVTWTLEWDPANLNSCWFWISNRGRRHAPWNGENVCVGAILATAPMNLGPAIAVADNPISSRGIPTAILITPDAPVTLSYRLTGAERSN